MTDKLAIIGSRGFPNMDIVRNLVSIQDKATVIVSGTEIHTDNRKRYEDVDWVALMAAWLQNRNIIGIPANWDGQGKSAGFIRNALIAEVADRCYAFWDGESRGTENTIDHFRKLGKQVEIMFPNGKYICHDAESSLLDWNT